jgi:hypothetical protein
LSNPRHPSTHLNSIERSSAGSARRQRPTRCLGVWKESENMQSIAEEKDHALSGRYLALLEVSSSNAVTANVRFLKFLMQNILLTIHHVLGSAKSAHARFQWDALNWTIRATQSNPIPYLDASLRGIVFSIRFPRSRKCSADRCFASGAVERSTMNSPSSKVSRSSPRIQIFTTRNLEADTLHVCCALPWRVSEEQTSVSQSL